ncbi:Rab-like protein 3 [Entomortierella parvispora]|uniref:Rab-like protein 3 n=1 Tax=Entomortierella parvispora TaxID=205924 RepID=A0A9P3HC82_9FUNG|nr:Rab-like protein 3 [Entomortierella parvispora]
MYSAHDQRGVTADSFKVLVLGDSGVGKTTLVHALCHDEVLSSPIPTVGCNVQVRLHSSTVPSITGASSGARSGMMPSLFPRSSDLSSPTSSTSPSNYGNQHQPKFIEFYDISGSPAVRDPSTRNMFYRGTTYQGIILVHDLCNRRSYDNLWTWIGSYLEHSGASLGYSGSQLSIPLLVVGTKMDMVATGGSSTGGPGALDLVQKYGGEAISVCTVSLAEFMPNSSTSIAFNMFLNQVMDPTSSSTLPRSRTPSSNNTYQGYSRTMPPSPSRITTTLPPPTPTPTQDRRRDPYQNSQAEDDESGSPVIPTMDFATFTGGSTGGNGRSAGGGSFSSENTHHPSDRIPHSSSEPHLPSSGGSSGFSSHPLRAQYERNRALQGQYSNMSVPVYTQPGSRGHTPSGSRS